MPTSKSTTRFLGDDGLNWQLWRRWIVANVWGELLGLGGAALAAVTLALAINSVMNAFAGLALAIVLVTFGAVEGLVVGCAQWRVLRQPLPRVSAKDWIIATALGAFVAWTLGVLPSTLIEFGAETSSDSEAEMSPLLMYTLAAVMGLVAGPILGFFQWRVLRRFVAQAGFWIAANAVAWAIGMPVIFIGASSSPTSDVSWILVPIVLLTVTIAASLVAAIHGLALIWLVRLPADINNTIGADDD